MKRFCVKCGVEESPTTPIINGLCPKCYIEVRGLVEKIDRVEIGFCRSCGAVNIRGKWINVGSYSELSDVVEDYIIDVLKPSQDFLLDDVRANFKPYEDSTAIITLFGKLGNTRIEHKIGIKMIWHPTLCPNCKRIVGGGHKAVVQIRYVNEDDEVEKFVDSINSEFGKFIKDIKPVKNGYDISLVDAGIAKKIAEIAQRRWPGVRVVETFGDVKRLSSGEKTARLYISIRILNFKPGDYIVVDGRPYTVESFDGLWLKLRSREGDLKAIRIDYIAKNFSKYRASS